MSCVTMSAIHADAEHVYHTAFPSPDDSFLYAEQSVQLCVLGGRVKERKKRRADNGQVSPFFFKQ